MRTTLSTACVVMVFLASSLFGQSTAPRTYTVTAEAYGPTGPMPIMIYRDGPKERIEMKMGNRTLATLFDFQAHKVYWIGWFGTPCSAGRYTSARAPIDQDPITGGLATVDKQTAGRKRTLVRTDTVNGIAARVEQIAGARPASHRREWPTTVWISQKGDFAVKVEGSDDNGRPATLFEIKQFTTDKPSPDLMVAPADCAVTNSEMDDSGLMRSHSEASINVEATGTADFDKDTTSSKVKVTSKTADGKRAPAKPPVAAAKLTRVQIQAAERPHKSPCGRKLRVTSTFTTSGRATVWYRLTSTAAGLEFGSGQEGTIDLPAAGDGMVQNDVTFTATKSGQLRLQAAIQDANGKKGPMKLSNVVPFQVNCGAGGGTK